MDYKIEKFDKYTDNRGDLIVFLRESNLEEKHKKFGQIYFVTFDKKGVIRGDHYHKKWREWFGIVAGRVEVVLEDIRTKERKKFILNADYKSYIRLEVGPYIAHSFKSTTTYAALLNYTDKEWSPNDTFVYKLF
jgi:dTDP-4-dehydrorhamnose 3,5-epimerase-like enzyme